MTTLKIGDDVRVIGVPESVQGLPEESKAVFKACVGGVYKITDERSGPYAGQEFELRVNEVWSDDREHYSCDTIWIEAEYLEAA
jgi:hypothetical protein